jgi:predicted Zn-dependent protease
MTTRSFAFLSLSLTLLSLLTAGCSTNPATGERQLMLISRQQEINIGNEAAPQFEDEFAGRVPDANAQLYVQDIGQRVAAVSERPMPYEFALLRSDIPNAFALPGGKIYVTVGLLEIMESERELAAVLGHEVGHVAAQHNVQALQRQVGASILIDVAGRVAGDSEATAEKVTEIVAGVANLRYSRGDEYQADELGLRYLAKAGYNPWGMVELLSALNEIGSGSSSLGEFFSTHPLTEKRIDEVRAMIRENHPSADPNARPRNVDRFRQMQQRAVRYKVHQSTSE